METIRSFIAIELPETAKDALRQVQSKLKSGNQSFVKWVEPNSIHLTLKFLGPVAVDRIEGITSAMETAAGAVTPLHLQLKELGVFPNLRRVQVVWVGLDGDLEKLNLLQSRIDSELKPLGFVPENRPFVAHLTLARVRESAGLPERQSLGELISRTKLDITLMMDVESISLMRSQLTPQGAIYSQTKVVKLG